LYTHIEKNGSTDPISRTKITKYQLIENKHIKGLVRNYLDDNPWAYECEELELPQNN